MSQPNSLRSFSDEVENLRQDHGDSVSLDDVAGIVESLVGTLEGDISAVEIKIHQEIRSLVRYLETVKSEIAAIHPAQLDREHISIATDELDAVVQATEDATGSILDAAEELEGLGARLGDEAADQIAAITAKIYEASNFQDITGQRITKVVAAIRHIEAKIIGLARVLGEDVAPSAVAASLAPDDDASLLNGPQLPGIANSQEDIDALLASFD